MNLIGELPPGYSLVAIVSNKSLKGRLVVVSFSQYATEFTKRLRVDAEHVAAVHIYPMSDT